MVKRYNHQNIEPLFKEYLSAEKVSKITIKNYLSDIRAFFEWSDIHAKQNPRTQETSLLEVLNSKQIESYLVYLQKAQKDIRSINRCLSSLRRFGQFCVRSRLITENPASGFQNLPEKRESHTVTTQNALLDEYHAYLCTDKELTEDEIKDKIYDMKEYYLYLKGQGIQINGPRDFADSENLQIYVDGLAYGHISEELIERKYSGLTTFLSWLGTSEKIASSVSAEALHSLKYKTDNDKVQEVQEVYTPQKTSLHKRGTDKINAAPIRYILIPITCVLMLIGVIWIYYLQFQEDDYPTPYISSKNEEGRTIHFQGRLYDENGQPVSTKQDVIFRLYESKNSNKILYEGACVGVDGVTPDQSGAFFTEIGSDCSMDIIPEDVFFSNGLYIGLTVNGGDEMRPRHALPTTSYARNSDRVKGLSVGSEKESIPYINEEGNLVIGSESPTIQSTAGQFTLEGNMLMMQTASGSKGSIFLNPDVGGNTVIGSGKLGVGVTNPEVSLDVFGDIQASGLLRFTNQQSLLTTKKGGVFRLGDVDTSHVVIKPQEYISIGTVEKRDKITLGGTVSPSTDGIYNLGREDFSWGAVFAQEFIGGKEGIQGYFTRKGSILTTRFSHDSFALGSETNKHLFLSGKEGESSWIRNGKFGIGTVNPEAALSVVAALDNERVSSFSNLSKLDSSDTNVMSLRLGTDPQGSASRFIEFIAGSSGETDGTKVGSIRLNNNAVVYETSGADFAEYFPVTGETDYGDIVTIHDEGIMRGTSEEAILGVVTDEAGFVGNAQQAKDGTLIGILGQIETHVTNMNGYIKKGEPVSTSGIGGYGARAVDQGQIVGRALEDMSERSVSQSLCPKRAKEYRDSEGNPLKCGSIRVMVSVQWYNPDISLTSTGDLKIKGTHLEQEKQDEFGENQPGDGYINDLSQYVEHNVRSFGEITSQTLTTTTASTQHIVAKSLEAVDAQILRLQADHIRSPVIETERIETKDAVVETIEPKESDITFDLAPERKEKSNQGALAEVMIKGMDDATVASIDARGNATFSGTVQTESVETEEVDATHITAEQMLSNLLHAEHATIAGTLRAGSIESDTITEIEDNVTGLSNSLQQNQSTLSELDLENDSLTSVVKDIQRTIEEIDRVDSGASDAKYDELENLILSYSKDEAEEVDILEKLRSSSIYVTDINVQGRAEMYDARISHSLTAGNIYIERDSVLSLGYELDISSLSTVTFFQNKVAISKDGSLVSQGAITAQRVAVADNEGNEVAALDNAGMASVRGIRVARTQEATPSALIITPAENKQKHGIEEYAIDTQNNTAGEALVPADSEKIIVYNDHITDSSLVYLTSTSMVSSSGLRVSRKEACIENRSQCKPYFEVSKSDPTSDHMSFNWLVIN